MQAIASEQRCRNPITVSAGHRDAKRHSEQTSDQISGTDIGAMIAQTDSASPSSTAITNYTKENPMTHAAATMLSSEQTVDGTAIRPFRVNVPEGELTELRRRINATKWPERETVTDASQGVQLAPIQALARYWGTEYDWRKIEAKMNALAAYFLDHDARSYELIARVFDGQSEGLTRDDILDNITMTWLRSPAELGRADVSQTDPFQQGGERRPLCGLGTAATLLRRGSRWLQTIAHERSNSRRGPQSPARNPRCADVLKQAT
jgi:hypothetical protein